MSNESTPSAFDDSAPAITVLSSKTAYENPWYRVRSDALIWPDGTHGTYNVVEVPPSVFIVPVTRHGEIVLIRQYRYTTQRWVWEIPAGGSKPGQTKLEAAKAELREETGGVSDDIMFLGEYETANGRSNSTAFIYLAKNVVLGESALESAEILTVHPTPIEQVRHMLATNQIKDAPSALGLYLALPHIHNS